MAFKDIIGQRQAIEILKMSLRENKISHTYLFVGPEGSKG
jgi:DNA polymerase-3 subunit delta'